MVRMSFMAYVLPVVILVGLFGNFLSFIVLVTPSMRKTSVYFYLTILSLSDSIVLIVSAFKTWLRIVFSFELLHQSSISCKVIFFFLNLSYHTSAWIVVLVTLDRFVAVWLPFKSVILCTVMRAKIATCLLVLILIAYNSHILVLYDLHPLNNATYCRLNPNIQEISSTLLHIKLFTYCVIPFIIILTFNILISIKLKRKPKILTKPQFDDEPRSSCRGYRQGMVVKEGIISRFNSVKKSKKTFYQNKLTHILLALCITWIILTLPYCLFSVVVTSFSSDPVVRFVLFQYNTIKNLIVVA